MPPLQVFITHLNAAIMLKHVNSLLIFLIGFAIILASSCSSKKYNVSEKNFVFEKDGIFVNSDFTSYPQSMQILAARQELNESTMVKYNGKVLAFANFLKKVKFKNTILDSIVKDTIIIKALGINDNKCKTLLFVSDP